MADDFLVALVAGPLAERMVRLRARPAGADEIRILAELPLRQVVGRRDRGDVKRLFGGAHRRQRIAGRGQQAADEHVNLVLQDQLLGLGDAGVRLALVVLDDELHVGAAELAAVFVEIELEAVDHVLADLGEDAGRRRDEADAQFFRAGRRGRSKTERQTAAQQQFLQFVCHCHSSLVAMTFLLQLRKASMPVPSSQVRLNFRFCLAISAAAGGATGFPSGPSADRGSSARRRRRARTATTAPAC